MFLKTKFQAELQHPNYRNSGKSGIILNINFVVVYGTKKFVLENFNRIHEIGLYFILRSCLTLERKRSAFKQEKSLCWESTGRHLSLGMCLKSGHKLNIADPSKVRFLNSTIKVLTSNAFTLAKTAFCVLKIEST